MCLPLLAGLAMHALWLRIDQYGLTPDRVLAALLALVAMVHGLALVRAVIRRDAAWLRGLRQSNPPLALFAACLLVLMHVPALSPLHLSAASQYQRLLSDEVPVERTDMGALRFQLGEPGRQHQQALRQQLDERWEDEARRTGLQADLQRLDKADHYWAWKREQEVAAAPPVPWIGEPVADGDGSLARAVNYQGCVDSCSLFAVDLDRDGQPEVLLLWAEPWAVPVFGQAAAGGWQRIGQRRITAGVLPDSDLLSGLLQRGEFELVAPRFNAIEIDGVRLEPAIER